MGLFSRRRKKKTEPEEPAEPTIPPEALVPWVHRRSHLHLMGLIAIRAGREPLNVRLICDSFAFTVALGTSEGPVPVKKQHLEALGLDFDEAMLRALQNVAPTFRGAAIADGLALFETNDETAGGALLLGPVLFPKLPLKGAAVAMLPHARLLLVAGDRDEAALARMLDLAQQEFERSSDWRSLDAVRFDGSASFPKDWFPPKGHPLAATFRALRSRSYTRVAVECLAVETVETAEPPLAHLAALPPDRGGGLVAAWARGTSVAIPDETERVVLLDTPDEAPDRVEVRFDMLREVLPAVFEAVGTYEEPAPGEDEHKEAPFWRTRGSLFPSARAKAFLISREAHDAAHPDAQEREVPPAELLAAWDAGVPVLADATLDGNVDLRAPDRRRAMVSMSEAQRRVDALPPADRGFFLSGLRAAQMLGALGGDEAAMAALESNGDLPARIGELMEEGQRLLTPILTSDVAKSFDAQAAEAGLRPGYAKALMRLKAAQRLMFDPTKLYPVLRPPGYGDAMMASVSGQVAHLQAKDGAPLEVQAPERPAFPFQQGIELEIVADAGNQMITLSALSFPPGGFGIARSTALLNLAAASLAPLTQMQALDAFEGPWRDGYAASRLLVPGVFGEDPVRGERLVFAPHVNRVWLVGSEDVAGMTAVLDAIDAYLASGEATTPYQWRELLLARPWALRGGAVAPWELPPEHALARRIVTLEADLERRRQSSAAHAGSFAQAARRMDPESEA